MRAGREGRGAGAVASSDRRRPHLARPPRAVPPMLAAAASRAAAPAFAAATAAARRALAPARALSGAVGNGVPYDQLVIGEGERGRERGRAARGHAPCPTPTRSPLFLGVPKESHPGEARVALTPTGAASLLKAGFKGVVVEAGAGARARVADAAYAAAGATLASRESAFGADIVLKVRPPSAPTEAALLKDGGVLVSPLDPSDAGLLSSLQSKRATAIGINLIPRTLSRAQAFDVLSSQANVAGSRAVIEASAAFPGLMAGQSTAAGRISPVKVLVIGGGVAGLAAAGCARGLGAVVRIFDTRAAVAEQAASMGAEFLTVSIQESGEGGGGYAKAMSDAFLAAERSLFEAQAPDVDIIISTAMIPGQVCRWVVCEEEGAACETRPTRPLSPARAAPHLAQSSVPAQARLRRRRPGRRSGRQLRGDGAWGARHNGQRRDHPRGGPPVPRPRPRVHPLLVQRLQVSAVHGAVHGRAGRARVRRQRPGGARRVGAAPGRADLAAAAGPRAGAGAARPKERAPAQARARPCSRRPLWSRRDDGRGRRRARGRRARADRARVRRGDHLWPRVRVRLPNGVGGGARAAQPAHVGDQCDLGWETGRGGRRGGEGVGAHESKKPRPQPPPRAGLCAVGAMHYVGGGFVPTTAAQGMAAVALAASAVNVGGGFHVTRSMLALFRRPGDPPDHVGYYAVPTGVLIAGTWAGQAAGLPGVTPAAYLASSVLCIAAIACLARQDTARLGNALGVAGVAGGVAAAAGALEVDVATAVQLAGLLAAGGGTGLAIARRMATTDLPQTVAGFHALVGGAAVLTSAAAALAGGAPDALHTAATVAGTVIGAITLTGSAVAYGKLAGHLPSAPLALPGKNAINLGLAGLTGLAGASALSAGDAAGVATSLAAATASASLLGAHTTASIGGADMPVVVTLLNSYSGYALCAEGFLLGNDLLTSVGALIGASGGILSYIMCAAMNRSLANVVFGGYAVKAKAVKPAATGDERQGGRAGAVGLVAASSRRPPTPPPPPQPPPPTSPPWPTCWFMPRTSSSCRGTAWRSPARRATSRRWPPRCGRPARACASPSTPSPDACRASSTCCWPSRGCRTTGCLRWMKSMKTSPPRTWSSSLAPTTR